MSNFGKIRHKNDSFLADDIRLDRAETIKVFGEDDTIMGLSFLVPCEEARINDQWRKGESQTRHFHMVFL